MIAAMKHPVYLIASLVGLSAVSAGSLFAQDAPPAAPATPVVAAPPGSTNTPAGAARRGGPAGGARRGGTVDLGPLPEIHAAVPNTLPGLLGKPLKWKSTGILVGPSNDATHVVHSIKDPTIFRYKDKWEIYATAHVISGPAAVALQNPSTNQPATGGRRGGGGGTFNMIHVSFADWKDAPKAPQLFMDTLPGFGSYKCAPEVFYFAPQKKWYYTFQTQPAVYCTSDTPDDPKSWTAPAPFFAQGTPMPNLPIDYHFIGDGKTMYMFYRR